MTTPTTSCPGCSRPDGLHDEAVRAHLERRFYGADLLVGGARWHVVQWRRCPVVIRYGVSDGMRCALRDGHLSSFRPHAHETDDGVSHCLPLGPNSTLDARDDPPSWPVPCWVTTAAEAERWRGEGETAATSAPRCGDLCEGAHEDGGAVPSCSFVAGHRGMCLCPECADEYNGESGEALREQALAEEEAARAARAPGGGVRLPRPGGEPLVLRTMGEVEDAVREGILRQTGPSHYEVLGRELLRSYLEGSNPFATPHPPGTGGERDLLRELRAGLITPDEALDLAGHPGPDLPPAPSQAAGREGRERRRAEIRERFRARVAERRARHAIEGWSFRGTITLRGPTPAPPPPPATLWDAAVAWLARRHASWLASEERRVAEIRERERATAARARAPEVAAVNRALVTGSLGLATGGLPVDGD
jgi:hypothetical protein